MAHIEAKAQTTALSADGTATGSLTFASTAGFYVGAECFLIDDDAGSQIKVLIREIVSTTVIKALKIADNSGLNAQGMFVTNFRGYGVSDFSAFTLAKHAKLSMPAQVVRIEYTNAPSPT